MVFSNEAKSAKSLFQELPYNGFNITYTHGQFNNSLVIQLPTKKYLERLVSIHDLDLFNLNINSSIDPDYNTFSRTVRCKYYSPSTFTHLISRNDSFESCFSFFHTNLRSLRKNLGNLQTHILSELSFHFSLLAVSETRINNENLDFNPCIPNYNFEFVPTPLSAGGVGMYIDVNLRYRVIEKTSNEAFQALWIEIEFTKKSNIICGVVYRQHNSPERFLEYFEETIDRYSATGKSIYILGDVNINILRSVTCNYAQQFLNCLQSYALLPTIDKPTRVYNDSATLIDNIFINKFGNYSVSGNIVSDVTDHFSQFCILKTTVEIAQPKKIKLRDYSKFSQRTFLQELSELTWDSTSSAKDPSKSFSIFYNKLNKLLNRHAPFRTLSKRKSKQLAKPWVTKGLRKAIKIKNELFYSGDRERYKFYRNKVLLLSRVSKRNYYHPYFESNINNIKKTWEGINILMSRKKKFDKVISSLKRPDHKSITSDPTEIPDILNKHFTSIGHKLASKISHSVAFSQYLPRITSSESFSFNPVLPGEIEVEIKSLPPNKALGLYSFPVKILKSARQLLSKPLATIMNRSIESGIYPSKLKLAKVVPVFKSEDEVDPNNYRPISLLSIFNRIFEKLMYNRLKSFLDKQNLLYNCQYGFREKCSTQHALIDIVNRIQLNIDKNLFSCGIFIDLKKAFDTVDHSILLQKLEHYGIRGLLNNWFSSYLTDRYQTTQVGSHVSKKERCLCGVPQGSVLGPLLFLLYINDIYNSSKKLSFHLFADDTNLLYADKNLKSLETVVNEELRNIGNWLMANKLSLNVKKSNFVIFRPYQKRIDYEVDIKIFDYSANCLVSLERKVTVKYLGVLIDSKLSWTDHITYISTKISKSLGILARLRHFVPSRFSGQVF